VGGAAVHLTLGEWITWATGVGIPKTTEHQRHVPAARRPSGETQLKEFGAGWAAGAATFIVAVRSAGYALSAVRIAAHHHIAPVAGAVFIAASGVSASGHASVPWPTTLHRAGVSCPEG
jgi:hypothetical protein